MDRYMYYDKALKTIKLDQSPQKEECKEGEVVVKVLYSTLSSEERNSIYLLNHEEEYELYRYIRNIYYDDEAQNRMPIGNTNCIAEIIKVGSKVEGFEVGQRVAVLMYPKQKLGHQYMSIPSYHCLSLQKYDHLTSIDICSFLHYTTQCMITLHHTISLRPKMSIFLIHPSKLQVKILLPLLHHYQAFIFIASDMALDWPSYVISVHPIPKNGVSSKELKAEIDQVTKSYGLDVIMDCALLLDCPALLTQRTNACFSLLYPHTKVITSPWASPSPHYLSALLVGGGTLASHDMLSYRSTPSRVGTLLAAGREALQMREDEVFKVRAEHIVPIEEIQQKSNVDLLLYSDKLTLIDWK